MAPSAQCVNCKVYHEKEDLHLNVCHACNSATPAERKIIEMLADIAETLTDIKWKDEES